MVNITSFVYCAGFEPAPEGPKLVNPLQFVSVKFFPTQYSFAISFGLFDLVGKDKITLGYKFVNPDGEVIHPTNADLPITTPPGKKHLGAQLNMELKNIVFNKPGVYMSQVSINGEQVGEYPIFAFEEEKE